MTNNPTLTDLALAARAEQLTTQAHQADGLAGEAVRGAKDFAAYVLGSAPASLLTWEAEAAELYAARGDLPDTPGWYLRWASDGEEETSLALHRPCNEDGHRDLVEDLADLGRYLATLADR